MSEQITNNPSVPSQVVAEVTFPKFINNLGIIPTSYKDSMSYYECLAWLCKYLEETVIPTVNQNGQAVEELQELYIELNNYVTHYFDTLDVQEEINNKLDDMVEQGTLQEIIADYLNSKAVFGFDSVADMLDSTNLINGSYAQTYGFYSKNDMGGALYKIRTITTDDIVDNITIIPFTDTLIAELILEDTMNVNQFGASSQNLNNTTNIQKAIDMCSTVILNNETYNISSGLIIDKPCKIIGKNNTRALNSPTLYGENMNVITIYGNTTGVILENFNIKSNYERDGEVTSNGIYCSNNTYHLTFKNIQISHCKNGIFANRTWNMLIENVITDTCDNGFNSAGTVTSSSFISCVSYNCHFGWFIRGGFVYNAFYSCGSDHTDTAIRCEGSGSIDTYNLGAEDYKTVYSVASNANGISLNIHNTFFYPSERTTREILFQGNNCNIYDCVFPNNTIIDTTYPVNYINCTNIPNTSLSIVDGNPLNTVKKIENNKLGVLKGFKTYTSNSTITLQRNQSEDCYLIGKLIAGTNSKISEVVISSVNTNHKVENSDDTLVTVSFSDYDITITFLEACQVDVDLKYRNYR